MKHSHTTKRRSIFVEFFPGPRHPPPEQTSSETRTTRCVAKQRSDAPLPGAGAIVPKQKKRLGTRRPSSFNGTSIRSSPRSKVETQPEPLLLPLISPQRHIFTVRQTVVMHCHKSLNSLHGKAEFPCFE